MQTQSERIAELERENAELREQSNRWCRRYQRVEAAAMDLIRLMGPLSGRAAKLTRVLSNSDQENEAQDFVGGRPQKVEYGPQTTF